MFAWIFRRLLQSFTGGGAAPENIGGIFTRALWSWPRKAKRDIESWTRQVWRELWTWRRVAKWRPGVASQLEPMELVKAVSDNRVFGFDYSDAPEVFDGSTVIDPMVSGTISGGSGLTFGSVTVITAAFDDIPINGGLKCTISGGVAGTVYQFACIGTTTAGRILTIPCRMTVVADIG